ISFTVNPALLIASAATPNCVLHISLGSCSTQPGCGKICVNSFCAMLFIIPFLSNTIARELVVPWSKARIYCGILNKQLGAENKSFTPIVQENSCSVVKINSVNKYNNMRYNKLLKNQTQTTGKSY